MRSKKLTARQVATRAKSVPNWRVVRGKLHREFKFDSFVEAFGFMSSVALIAEKHDHHPDWSNAYSSVVIDLQSHDVGGLSARDFDLALAIDELLA